MIKKIYFWSILFGILAGCHGSSTQQEQVKDFSVPYSFVRDSSLAHSVSLPFSEDEGGEWGRNPFRPPTKKPLRSRRARSPKTHEESQLRLTGIIGRGEERKALINGKLLRRGDVIDGWTIMDIKNGKVILRKSTRVLILRLIK